MRTFNLHKRKPLVQRRYRRGDVGPDGRIFWAYMRGREAWLTRERFEEAQHQLKTKLLNK